MSLDSLKNIGQNARVRWDQGSNAYVQDGNKPGNVFSRVVDWAGRSEDQVQTNKDTARRFIDDLEAKYGGEVAQFATRQLGAHLAKGRPLSKRRVEIIRAEAKATKERIASANAQKLDDKMVDDLARDGLRANGIERTHAQERRLVGTLAQNVRQAIKSDPAFAKEALSDHEAFKTAFDSVIKATAASFLQEMKDDMGPLENLAEATWKAGRLPSMDTLDRIGSELFPGQDPEASKARGLFESSLRSLSTVANLLAASLKDRDPDDVAGNASDERIVMTLTGSLDSLRHTQEAIVKMRAEARSDREREILEAALKDAAKLGDTMKQAIGLDTLGEADLAKVLDASRAFSDVEERLQDPRSHLLEMFNDPERLSSQLRSQKQTFTSIGADGPARTALDALARVADDNLRKYRNLLPRMEPFRTEIELMTRADRLLQDAKQGATGVSQLPQTIGDMAKRLGTVTEGDGDSPMAVAVRELAGMLQVQLVSMLSDAEDLAPLDKSTAAVGDGLQAASKAFEAELKDQQRGNMEARNRGSVMALVGELHQAELVKEEAGKAIAVSRGYTQSASTPEKYEEQKAVRRAAEASIQRNLDGIDAQAVEARRRLGLDSLSPDDYRKVLDARSRLDEIDAQLRQPQSHLLALHADPERLSRDLEDVRGRLADVKAGAGAQTGDRGRQTLDYLSDAVDVRRQEYLNLRQSMAPFKQELDTMADADRLLGAFAREGGTIPDSDAVDDAVQQLERIARGSGGSRTAGWIRDEAASLRAKLMEREGWVF